MEDLLILFICFLIIMGLINVYKTKNSKVRYIKSNLYDDTNSEYLVRYKEGTLPNDDAHNCQAGANAICFMRKNLIALVARVKQDRCNGGKECNVHEDGSNKLEKDALTHIKQEEIEMLIDRFNPDNISESTPDDKYTSYSVNKGEKIIFCIREKVNGKNPHEIIDINTLMFVAIHELAHVMTKSIGHGDDFWNNMRYLLSVAVRTPAPTNYQGKGNDYKGNSFYTNNIAVNSKWLEQKNIYYYVNYAEDGASAAYCGTNISTTPCKNDKCTP